MSARGPELTIEMSTPMSAPNAVDGSSHGARKRLGIGCPCGDQDPEELIMLAITTVGLDIAKSVFQVMGSTHEEV